MQEYIDRTYYLSEYNGKVPDNEIDTLIIEASSYIQKHTSNRATSDIEEVRYCCCVIVDKINEYNEIKKNTKKQNGKKSETVGKMSVTYNDNKSVQELKKEMDSDILDIIKLHLSNVTDKNGVRLLYRGN